MPSLPIFIEQAAYKAQAETSPREYRTEKAQRSAWPANSLFVFARKPELPSAQPQGLATMSPKPAIKNKADDQQIRRIKKLVSAEGFALVEG